MNSQIRYHKNTTFTKRPGIPQIGSYLVFGLQTALFYGIVLPHYQNPTPQITFAILYTLSLISLIISTLISSCTDPSDSVMIKFKNNQRQQFQLFRKNYVGKLLYCDYCQSYVRQKSRHCKSCDRCTQDFDHHCMWINNCVGGINYRSFFAMIISAFINLFLYVLALIFLTAESTFPNFMGGFISAWISGSINSIFVLLLINLIMLHFYLIYNGLSTYEFILVQRAQQKRNKQEQQKKNSLTKGGIIDSHKIEINHDKSVRDSQEQNSNQQLQMKDVRKEITSAIQVRSKSSEQDQEHIQELSRSGKRQADGQSHAKSIIFGQKELTEKSEMAASDQGHLEHGNENQVDNQQSDGESSVEISQLFTRNKSLKLIIGKNQYYKPHKPHRVIDKQLQRTVKSKSMFTGTIAQ